MQTADVIRRSLFTLAIVAVLATAGSAQGSRQEHATQRPFASGGTAYLDLSAGEYRISASPDNSIRVVARSTSKHTAEETTVRIDVTGTRADVVVDGPMNDGAKVEIQLPRHTNLITELTAGELQLRGIEGSKNISARAGELNIEVGDRNRYRNVSASVKVGELNASPFNVQKEGLFRSFSWKGTGKDDMSVSLWAGELTLN